MENTIENKSIFLAQYFGQKVFEWKFPENSTEPGTLESYPDLKTYANCLFLNLKPLSQLSDEDALEIAKFYYGEKHVETHPLDHFKYVRAIKENITDKLDGVRAVQIIDYLRRHGYALLYLTLTIEKQIEYGWVKLNTQ